MSKFKEYYKDHPEYLKKHYDKMKKKDIFCEECQMHISLANKTLHPTTKRHIEKVKCKAMKEKTDDFLKDNKDKPHEEVKAFIEELMKICAE